jgi:ZIP family zinc transporter
MVYLVGIATIISTFLGGLFAIRLKDKLHLILGFSAGAVIGVAFFDLEPESIILSSGSYEIKFVTFLIAVGFIAFMVLDRFFSIHMHDHDYCENETHTGRLSVFALCLHSFLDGLGIGLAFKVAPSVGWIVAAAVLAHDFSDGINTIGMVLKGKGKIKEALNWLILDALAPMAGIIVASFLTISEPGLGLVLAIFAGLFIYIGASDLIPESYHHHKSLWTTLMTILGAGVLYIAIHFAG